MSAGAGLQERAARGRLRIYLSYAPGAGTTCALLSEGRQRAEHGTDVVLATAETHGRPYTENLLAGLEVIPCAEVPYRGTLTQEMDLRAVLARGPAVALVDDLAHLKVPGSRHRSRWQDVEDLLAAGIDVISTIRAGHVDSLADVAAKITGTAPADGARSGRPRCGRGRAGGRGAGGLAGPAGPRPHLPGRPRGAALGGWFQTGNLLALRELALLWLSAGLGRHLRGGGDLGSGQARERVVVALSGGPEGETLIRRAARIAARSGGGLDVHIVTCTPTANGCPATACEPTREGSSDDPAEHLLAWRHVTSGTTGPGRAAWETPERAATHRRRSVNGEHAFRRRRHALRRNRGYLLAPIFPGETREKEK